MMEHWTQYRVDESVCCNRFCKRLANAIELRLIYEVNREQKIKEQAQKIRLQSPIDVETYQGIVLGYLDSTLRNGILIRMKVTYKLKYFKYSKIISICEDIK